MNDATINENFAPLDFDICENVSPNFEISLDHLRVLDLLRDFGAINFSRIRRLLFDLHGNENGAKATRKLLGDLMVAGMVQAVASDSPVADGQCPIHVSQLTADERGITTIIIHG